MTQVVAPNRPSLLARQHFAYGRIMLSIDIIEIVPPRTL